MNMKKCEKGHIYDADKFLSCPHCISLGDNAMPESFRSRKDTDRLTSTYSDSQVSPDETTGWLVCIKGVARGLSFPLYIGKNLIGRAANMNVCLEYEDTVPREACLSVIYDRDTNMFSVHPEPKSLDRRYEAITFLNGKRVDHDMRLSRYDIIRIGKCELMFIPFCDEHFRW